MSKMMHLRELGVTSSPPPKQAGKLVESSITEPRIVRLRWNLVCECIMGTRRLRDYRICRLVHHVRPRNWSPERLARTARWRAASSCNASQLLLVLVIKKLRPVDVGSCECMCMCICRVFFWVFAVSFFCVFAVCLLFDVVSGCQYRCNRLSGNTGVRSDQLCVDCRAGRSMPLRTTSLAHSGLLSNRAPAKLPIATNSSAFIANMLDTFRTAECKIKLQSWEASSF